MRYLIIVALFILSFGVIAPDSTASEDSIPPVVIPQSVLPAEGGNAVRPRQPLYAQISDNQDGSGVDMERTVFILEDNTAGTTRRILAATYDSTTLWAETAPVELEPGHLYRITVETSDKAGNRQRFSQRSVNSGGGFLAISTSLSPSRAQLDTTSCSLSLNSQGAKDVSCPESTVRLDPSRVSFSGSRSGNVGGFVKKTVPGAHFSLRDPAFRDKRQQQMQVRDLKSYESFQVSNPSRDSVHAELSASEIRVSAFRTTVPKEWESAVLELNEPFALLTLDNCSDPKSSIVVPGGPRCSLDPLQTRYAVVMNPFLNMSPDAIAPLVEDVSPVGSMMYMLSAPQEAADELRRHPEVVQVLPVGGFDAVYWWSEQGCDSHVLTMGSFRSSDANSRGQITSEFESGQACEITPKVISRDNTEQVGLESSSFVASIPCVDEPCDFEELPPVADPPCGETRATTLSTSHVIQDVVSWDLAWLRSLHKFYWDGCNAWFDEGASRARTGSGPSWWNHDWPGSRKFEWVAAPAIYLQFGGKGWSDGNAPDCDIMIESAVAVTFDGDGLFATDKEVTGRNPACKALHSTTSPVLWERNNESHYWGNSDDKIVMIKRGGDERQ